MAAYHSGKLIYGIAVFTSALTAFYMFRLYYSIFWGKEFHHHGNAHGEGTLSMKISLIVLSICTIFAGFVPVSSFVTSDGLPLESHVDMAFSAFPVLMAVTGILLATYLYKTQNNKPRMIASSLGKLYKTVYSKFYIDEVYLFITKKIIFNGIGRPAAWIDKNIVDGFMNSVATITGNISVQIKGLQSGKVQNYALYFFGGIIGLAALFIYLLK